VPCSLGRIWAIFCLILPLSRTLILFILCSNDTFIQKKFLHSVIYSNIIRIFVLLFNSSLFLIHHLSHYKETETRQRPELVSTLVNTFRCYACSMLNVEPNTHTQRIRFELRLTYCLTVLKYTTETMQIS